MFQIEGIHLFLCISQIIYRSLNIQAVNISINQNITGLVGENDTHLTCTFTKDINQNFINVAIVARNENEIFLHSKPVAIFPPDKMANLPPTGEYLSGRVTLTNITKESTTATMRFDNLKCEDEKVYICTFNYVNVFGGINHDESEQTRIFVKAFPLMPESISYVVIALIRKAKQDNSSAGFTNNTNNILFSTKQNDNSSFYTLLADTVTSTPLKSTEKPVSSFREGDIIQFTCKGNIGKPPGKFIWQIIPQQGKPKIYSNETTTFELIPDVCSNRGTSNLTVEISADHFKAKIQCYEESQADILGKFVETEPIDVFYTVRDLNINKRPNQKQYDKNTPTITLTCKGDGNPKPTYKWFRQENTTILLSSSNLYIIQDVIQNNSGVYICEAYNTIDDVEYNANLSVQVDIVDELGSSKESESSKMAAVHAVYVILIICAVIICALVVKYYYNPSKIKKREKNDCQKLTCNDSNVNAVTHSTVSLTELDGVSDVNKESKNNSRSSREEKTLVTTVNVNPILEATSDSIYADPCDEIKLGHVSDETDIDINV